MSTLTTEQIRSLREDIESQLAKTKEIVVTLEADLADLEATDRVLARIDGEGQTD